MQQWRGMPAEVTSAYLGKATWVKHQKSTGIKLATHLTVQARYIKLTTHLTQTRLQKVAAAHAKSLCLMIACKSGLESTRSLLIQNLYSLFPRFLTDIFNIMSSIISTSLHFSSKIHNFLILVARPIIVHILLVLDPTWVFLLIVAMCSISNRALGNLLY